MNCSGKLVPLLSVIIPTRNRAGYAVHSTRNVLSISSAQLELVLQDNSDNDELETFVRYGARDPRVRYDHTLKRLDVIENFNKATEMATGEYICYIGDDDGVNPEIVYATMWAKEEGLDALLPTRPAQYWWPDLRFRYYGASSAGTLDIKPFTGRLSFPDAEVEMRKCAKMAGQDFVSLPKVYYGIVKRECVERVKEKTGTYFPGPSPDLAGAIAVANYVKRMCKVDYPLFLPGSSGRSGAGLGARKKHVGRLTDQAHLPETCIYNWSNIVPAFFSGNTIWAEDVVQALRATGREDILQDFNVPLLHAMCAVFNPPYLPITIRSLYRALRASEKGYLQGTLQFIYGYLYTWGLRFKSLGSRLSRPWSGLHMIKGLSNIEEAANALTNYLKATGRRFGEHL